MNFKLTAISAAVLAATLSACGGGSDTGSSTASGSSSTPNTLAASPASVTLGVGKAQSITLSQPGYTGPFTVNAAGCNGIVRMTNGNGASYTVTGENPGSCAVTFASSIGTTAQLSITVAGIGVAELDKPMGIAFSGGKLYVASSGNNEVLIYDEAVASNGGVSLTPDALSPISDGIVAPQALAFDATGNLYVANGGSANTVTVYDSNGTMIPSQTITQGINGPSGVAVDHTGTVFVSNAAAPGTLTYYTPIPGGQAGYSLPFGKLTADNGTAAVPPGPAQTFATPGFVTYVAGDLVVGVAGPNGVLVYPDEGTASGAAMPFKSIHGAALTPGIAPAAAAYFPGNPTSPQVQPQFYVSDTASNSIAIFDANWNPVSKITNAQGVIDPYGVAVDAAGNIFVASRGTNQLTVFDPTGAGMPILTVK